MSRTPLPADVPAPVPPPSPAPLLPLPLLATNEPPAAPPESMPDSADRVADARQRCAGHLLQLFSAAGLAYPAREVYLRVFKHEG